MNQKPTLLFSFIFGVCFLANSQIINKGMLKVASGTTVYFHDEYTNTATGNHVSDGDFYLNDNFINNGLTSADDGTTYFKSAKNNLLTLTGESKKANFYNLEIDVTADNKKGVLVADEFSLEVANAVNLISGDLRLTGKAQLIQKHPGLSVNTIGSGKLLIDQKGTTSPYAYDYWSSPVNNGGTFSLDGGAFDGSDALKNPFNPTQILFNSGKPYNGLPPVLDANENVTKALTINKRWLYKYAQAKDSYWEWKAINASTPLRPGEGYTMKGAGGATAKQNYVYYGAPNNGDYSFPIASGQSVLLGNPYPSALDAEKFLNDNTDLIEQIRFWVDGGSPSHYLSDYMGGYATRNKTGGTIAAVATLIGGIGSAEDSGEPSQFIPVGKGFFVDADRDGSIVFHNSQREFKNEASRSAVDNKYIRLGYEGPEGFHRQVLLGFMPNSQADLGYNVGYDAIELMPRKDDMFFVIEGASDKPYIIQGVNAYSEVMEFPLGLALSESGAHQLMLDEVDNFTDTVYLRDNLLNITHNLTESNFKIDLPAGAHLDRYSLVFQPSETLATPEKELDHTTAFYNGKNQIVITKPSHLNIKSVAVYNVMGQHILSHSENLTNQNKIIVPFNENPGVYVVVLNTSTSKKSTKILKY